MSQLESADIPSVAVLVDTATGWGRRLIRGVCSYASRHGAWHVWFEPLGRGEATQLPRDWDGDGIIARVGSPRMADALSRLEKPVINVSAIDIDPYSFPRVTNDNHISARLAAEHFAERGFRHFAYVGPLNRDYVCDHANAFAREAAQRQIGYDCFDYLHESMTHRSWRLRRQSLGAWLEQLPKPIGLFSWATNAAAQVLDVCRSRGIDSPEQVAVLAGDDDELLCEATTPRLSAIVTASEHIGYRAAELLDLHMQRKLKKVREERIAPLHIRTRQSTDVLAVANSELAVALALIRRDFAKPVTVREIAAAVPMSRRTLERSFRDFFGRTPLDEIRRLRLDRARELVIETELPMSRIALLSGFGTPEYLTACFSASFGSTPLKYRKTIRTAGLKG
ncbi:substrate-binding domain-containing protein [Planctomicrobium sp. SH664]|uniref:XylR family transcriptional regulator n=1 Tax=Planctomicrobium sp. SH664 TaxID=3448125 RepID=UPI003F5CA0C4